MQVLYTAEATAVGGRGGHIRSSDGVLDLSLAHPKELGGPGGEATNPNNSSPRATLLVSRARFCAWRASAKPR